MKSISTAVAAVSMSFMITAWGKTVYVDWTTGVDAEGRGDSFNPVKSAEYGLSLADEAGDVVRLAPGEYRLEATPRILKERVSIIGDGATRDDVVFDGHGQMRCLDAAQNGVNAFTNLTVSGITFRNGYCADKTYYASWTNCGAGVRLCIAGGNTATVQSGVVITNCAFVGCTNLWGNGGGLIVEGGARVVDCLFKDNFAGRDPLGTQGFDCGGGGVFAHCLGADVTLDGCRFENNVASNGIGAVGSGAYQGSTCYDKFSIHLKDCTFVENKAFYCQMDSLNASIAGCLGRNARLVEDCTFVSNGCYLGMSPSRTAFGGTGAGVMSFMNTAGLPDGRTNSFARCTFVGNYSGSFGGAFYCNFDAPLAFTGCTFRANETYRRGSAIFAWRCNATDCTFERNRSLYDAYTAGNNAGAVCALRFGRFVDCDFSFNEGDGYYSALNVGETTYLADSLVDRCRFFGNVNVNTTKFSVQSIPGGVLATCADVRNCLFACNTNLLSVGETSGIYFLSDNVKVDNCTFVGNRTSTKADKPMVFNTVKSGHEIRNCLISDIISTGTLRRTIGAESFCAYCWCDLSGLPTTDEAHNIKGTDPLFVSPATGDWSLARGSECVNAGVKRDWMASGSKDLAGNPRVSGIGPDIGCYEYLFRSGLYLLLK